MTDPDATITAIKLRITAAQRARIRCEHDRDTAAAQAERARARLVDEFGVSTVEDAKVKLAELEADLNTELEQLRTLLDEIGA